MKRGIAALLLAALVWLACFAGASAGEPQPLTDSRGREITVKKPQRVVSLYGSYAEAWLLAGGALVGVTEDAVSERGLELPEGVRVIGTTKEPNLELVLALDPDLVLLSVDVQNQLAACETLEAAGVPCAAFRVDTYTEYARMMRVFTALTERPELYEAQIPPMLAQIQETIAAAKRMEPPTALLIRAYSTGAKAKGEDNLAGVMLRDLGCVNIASKQPSLLEELTLEAIVAEDPDFIFVSVMGSDEAAALAALDATLGRNPAWQGLSAIRAGRMYVLPKALFHYKPNARWGESYAYLYNLLFEP